MKKRIEVMRAEQYVEVFECDCIDIGVEYVYIGVYDDGEDVEYSEITGWVFEDGMCMLVGCHKNLKCEFSIMFREIENNLDLIEKCYN